MNTLPESFLQTWSNFACWLTLPIDVRRNVDAEVYYDVLALQDQVADDISTPTQD